MMGNNNRSSGTPKRTMDRKGSDFFPTPGWATFALIDNEKFIGDIWECACGDGAMPRVLERVGHVISTDLHNRGYGKSGCDFLKSSIRADNIVTNPPFNKAEGFARTGIRLARRKLALLMRLGFLEGAERAKGIFAETPPARVWVFSERVTFYPPNVEVKGTGICAYAWFVWDRDAPNRTELR